MKCEIPSIEMTSVDISVKSFFKSGHAICEAGYLVFTGC